MQNQDTTPRMDATAPRAVRLYYLDWLRVIAMLGVFLFHVTLVFSEFNYHIKNAEQSPAITVFLGFLFPWGMPFFFLIAGAGSWFALQRRTPGQYTRERFARLLIPLVVGSVLLSPMQLYLEWRHKFQTGIWHGSFVDFVEALAWVPNNPRFFGAVGYHLWFLGFLFCYALLTLPIFQWLKTSSGQGFVARLARLCERRGGILLFILPLWLIRLSLHPLFPYEHDWADFVFLLFFFILGHLLFADQRLTHAVQRDWPVMLAIGLPAFLLAMAIIAMTGEIDIQAAPTTTLDFVWWSLVTICSWCWTAFMLFVGMRFLNRSHKWLRYGQEAILPFFVVHHPVILAIAYFVVQQNAGILFKLLLVALSAFAVSLGLYQFVIRRVGLLKFMVGMKA
jgi:surface polysaccharide O-acyltransferase-like enzyme